MQRHKLLRQRQTLQLFVNVRQQNLQLLHITETEHIILRNKMPVEHTGGDPCVCADLPDGQILIALLQKQRFGGFHDIFHKLGIANFTNIAQLNFNGSSFDVEYTVDDVKLAVNAQAPVLVSYAITGDAFLRSSIHERLQKVEDVEIPRLTFEDLSPWLNINEIGLKGSATKVVRSFVPPTGRKAIRIDKGSPAEKAEKLVEYLKRDGLLGKKANASDPKAERTAIEKGNGRICVFVEQTSKGGCKNISLELLTPAIDMGDTAAWKVSAIVVGADNTKAIAELK